MLSGWFNRNYDKLMKPVEQKSFARLRAELIGHAHGQVLEVGSGTGINFPLYRNVSVKAIEPNRIMREASYPRAAAASALVEVIDGSAEKLPFEDDCFDTVVGTLVLCTIPDARQAVREMVRVCKPNGTLLLFEHVRVDNRILGALQDYITPVWKHLCDGCHLNRDTVGLLRDEGLHIAEIKSFYQGIFVTIQAINSKHGGYQDGKNDVH